MTSLAVYVETIKKERPLLNKIVEELGDLNVKDFSKRLFERGMLQKGIYRPEFINLLSLAFPKTPKNIIEQLNISLRKNPLVSTADHHSIINHPVYLNSSILLSLFAKDFSQNKDVTIAPPIFSFASVPLNNASYLRGILLSGVDGEKRFSFFGSNRRHESMYVVEPLSFSEFQINQWIDNNIKYFSKKDLTFVKKSLLELTSSTDIAKCSSFLEQTQVFNSWMWKKLFPDIELLFFPIEKIVDAFFRNILIKNKNLSLYKFLFEFSLERQDELFEGIYGAWNLSKLANFIPGGGTSYFWGINENKGLLPLLRKDGFLVSKEAGFRPIEWNLESINKALEEKRIVPSILSAYLVMAHYGLYCSGAFNQIGYLTPIINQYKKGLLEINEGEEAGRLAEMLTDGAHAFLYFLFGESRDKVVPLCTFNVLEQKSKINHIEEVISNINAREIFNITAPLIFPFIVSPRMRDAMKFSFEDIYLQLKSKVPENIIIEKW
jgi:hypothetical protein